MQDYKYNESIGENYNVFGIVGDTSCIDIDQIEANPYVEHVQRNCGHLISFANRMFHPQDTIVDVMVFTLAEKTNRCHWRTLQCRK